MLAIPTPGRSGRSQVKRGIATHFLNSVAILRNPKQRPERPGLLATGGALFDSQRLA
jgi:hypothetical protein